jgi:trimethylamine---corrinoid protein Co-methyltransferase
MLQRDLFQPLYRLSPEQCQRLHQASLEVLQRTGLRIFEAEALELLAQAGATVSDDNRVRIPARLVEQALSTVPRTVTLYDRHGRPAMVLDGHVTYFGPTVETFYVIDHRDGVRRRALLQDVVEAVTLMDALPNIDYLMSQFNPGDIDGTIADRYVMEAMLNYTTKPIVFVNYDFQGCVDNIHMAEAVAGSPEALQARPFVAGYINVTSSLRFNEESVQKVLYLAEKALPCIFVPGTVGGLSAPITIPALLVHRHMGGLAGLVLSQLKRPGTPFIITGTVDGSLDMRNLTIPYGEAEHRGAAEALAHHLNLPQFSTAGVSDAHLVDEQAGIEAALTILAEVLSGGQAVHNVALLEEAMLGSLAQLVICDEIINWVRTFAAPIDISDESLALDLIDQVGPDGQFLDSDHTRRHYRERWSPKLFERGNYERWVARGSKTLGERAAERAEKILATHRPDPLQAIVAADVHNILQRAVAEAKTERR